MSRVKIAVVGVVAVIGVLCLSPASSPMDSSRIKEVSSTVPPSPRTQPRHRPVSTPRAAPDTEELSTALASEQSTTFDYGSNSTRSQSYDEHISDSDRARLAEMVKYAEHFAETYEPSSHTPPQVPAELEEKLRGFSPELLALVRVAAWIPPRAMVVPTPSS